MDDNGIPPSSGENTSGTESYSVDDFERLASTTDMYDRIALTLQRSDIDATVLRAVTLQLAGAPPRPQKLGKDVRGDIHLAIVSDASATLSRFLSAVTDLAPQSTIHLNGTNSSLAGIVGNVSGGALTPGPLLDSDIDLTVIEHFGSTRSKTQNAIQQIIDTSQYSFAKSNYHETVGAPGSILLATHAKYGEFDDYVSIPDQIDLEPALSSSVDLVLINWVRYRDELDTDEDPLPVALTRQYLEYARTIDPELSDGTRNEIREYTQTILERLAESDDAPEFPVTGQRLYDTLVRFTQAHARLRLADVTSHSDAARTIDLVDTVLRTLGVAPDAGSFDGELIKTGGDSGASGSTVAEFPDVPDEHIDQVTETVGRLQSEFEDGAPEAEVISQCQQSGLSSAAIESALDACKIRGAVYEPRVDVYRTT
ncbi:hypothetical protein C5C07_19175 [Haloferax sp. Atlit-4N]|uniref:minichromosome maintenance protein MCM n=1 Tax=Haloferax sp. Atlit-4N TaxID=2077206 RepID=UPI000E221716|nr:minichromosome maintenance protein MCM [Haloferax sp. Atlit-4N]RDZ50446.1 hypothetical protein C5C07_19175 [Haloferax sp. Atlit-4N]